MKEEERKYSAIKVEGMIRKKYSRYDAVATEFEKFFDCDQLQLAFSKKADRL